MQLDDRCGKLRSVELNAAGRSLREAEVGRVVECSWTIVCGKLRSVELLVDRCPGFDSTLG